MLTPSPAPPARPVPRRTSLAVALVAVLVVAVGGIAPARADAGAASQLVAWIGQERAAAGIGGLAVADDLVTVATRHAQRMAAEGRLYHNPRLAEEVSGWQRLTENVGHGPDARPVHDALMASTSHRGNILDAGVSEVGVGTARDAEGTLWVSQVFRQPTASAGPPPPSPSPTPSPAAPAPAPPAPRTHVPPPPPPTGPAVVAPRPRVLAFELGDVGVAPAPASIVAPADHGEVRPARSPVVAHLLHVARWVVVVVELVDA